jgi:hypothetical protein
MVATFSAPTTVSGSVPFGDEGGALYSQRRPYVMARLRPAFQVSCAKRLQFE